MRVRQAWRRHVADMAGAASTRAEGLRHAALLADLPSLGTVLCQSRHRARPAELKRWMADPASPPWPRHPWLQALWRASEISVEARVGPEGVREWLDFSDEAGCVWLRIWLLPDSDYCAWDALLARHVMIVRRDEASADPCLPRACLRARWQGLHGAPAALCRFVVRHSGDMQRLELSAVSGSSARTLAHADRVLHAAEHSPSERLWF